MVDHVLEVWWCGEHHGVEERLLGFVRKSESLDKARMEDAMEASKRSTMKYCRQLDSDFESLEHFDMQLLGPVPRSLRLNGKATCLRLEKIYWLILDYAAIHRNEPVNTLLASLDREVQLRFGRVTNFSSLVRVVSVMEVARACPDLLQWLTDRNEHE